MIMIKRNAWWFRLALAASLLLGCSKVTFAEDFSLDIGSAVAAGNFRAKNALFAVRSKGCAQPGKTELRGTAEGLVDGERRTVQLKHVTAMPTPGVFTVVQEWPPMGVWVVNLIAQCGESTASALVPIGPKGFVRESSKFFARPAAHEEITESLQGLAASPAQEQRAGSR
jgi:hypothetical protein